MKLNPNFLIMLFVLVCASCRTVKTSESVSCHTRTDSLQYFSHNTTAIASVQSVHDTVQVYDSVRVVVDSIGNVIREFHTHTENNIIREKGHDTIFIVMKDSAVQSATASHVDKETKEKIVVKKDYSPIWLIVILALLVAITGWLKKKCDGR